MLSRWMMDGFYGLGVYFEADDPGNGGGADPPADKPGDAPAPAPEPDKDQKFDAEYVRKLRAEAADYRKKAKDNEARLKALEDEKLSDSEKREKALKEATERAEAAEKRAHQAEVRASAAAAGAVNPLAVARLIDPDVEDVEKAVSALKKSDPYLFSRPGAGSADGGAGGAAPTGKSLNDFLREPTGRR